MKNALLFILSASLILSCNNSKNTTTVQPKELAPFSGFDLAKINFKERVYPLFSKVLMVDDERYDSTQIARLDFEKLDYISMRLTGAGMSVPKEKYGYQFESHTADSIVRFDSIYFDHVKMLTKRDTSLVAVWATGDYIKTKTGLDSALQHMKNKYGEPAAQYFISSSFHICSYEWRLPDRIIQMETSKGFSVSITSGNSKPEPSTYYKIEMIIVKKDELQKLANACTVSPVTYPEIKKLGWKDTLITGEYIPHSLVPQYKYDSLGIYSIDRAIEE